jgi:hypothetical protein
MRLVGKGKLRSLEANLRGLSAGSTVVVGVAELNRHSASLGRAGFADPAQLGERVLPAPAGPISDFNANGDYIVHRDQPMETAYREQVWTWYQWRGRYDRELRSRIVEIPYQRYPRTFRPPPAVELAVGRDSHGEPVVSTDPLAYTPANEAGLLHRINLMRELFGEAEIFTETLDPLVGVAVRRVNWEVLPPGQMPWAQLRQRIAPILSQMGERSGPVAERRLQLLTSEHSPDFAAVGRAGFSGYLVFGFDSKDLYVFESLSYGNATYVFTGDWEQLSQLTKADIIAGGLHEHRVIHREGWIAEMQSILR